MGQLRFETSTDSYLDPHDPARIRYDEFRAQYVNDDTLLVLLHSEEIFSFEFLERLRTLHEELENELPLVDEVTSLVNARVTRGSAGELIVEELLERWPTSKAELEEIEQRARANPVYTNTLLSEDARYTVITISITPGDVESDADALANFDSEPSGAPELPPILLDEELALVMESLGSIVERHRKEDLPIYITGNPEMSHSLGT